MESAKVISINISKRKGTKKESVNKALCLEDYGIDGDAHAGSGIRQVSLLSIESINKMKEKGLKVKPGSFAENITVEGIDLLKYALGSKFKIGEKVVLELSQIGKECQKPCSIYYQAGDCIMPKEGIFAKVKKGGEIKIGHKIKTVGTSFKIAGDTLQS